MLLQVKWPKEELKALASKFAQGVQFKFDSYKSNHKVSSSNSGKPANQLNSNSRPYQYMAKGLPYGRQYRHLGGGNLCTWLGSTQEDRNDEITTR